MFRWYHPGGPLAPDDVARLAASLLRDGFVVEDGMALPHARPGLGLEWDQAALARWAADA